MNEAPFTPGGTVAVSVTTASLRGTLPAGSVAQVLINAPASNSIAFIKFGDNTVVAALTDTPIMPGTVTLFSVPNGATSVAVISGTAATLYFTVGHGV